MKIIDLSVCKGIRGIEIRRLEKASFTRSFSKGQMIIRSGMAQKSIYFIFAGRVLEQSCTPSGKVLIYSIIDKGGSLGLASLLGEALTNSDFVAASDCVLSAIPLKLVSDLMNMNEFFRQNVFREIQLEISNLSQRLYDVRALDAPQRTRSELLRYLIANTSPFKQESSWGVIDRLPTHEEIANVIFSHREAVTKEICRLRKKGIIKKEGDNKYLANINKLRNMGHCTDLVEMGTTV